MEKQLKLEQLRPGTVVEVTDTMRTIMRCGADTFPNNKAVYGGLVPGFEAPWVQFLPIGSNHGAWNCSRVETYHTLSGIEEHVKLLKSRKQYPAAVSTLTMEIGSDPEIFAETSKGELIPAWKYLKDKKRSPTVFWDGFQAEFTTSARTCLVEYTSSISSRLQTLQNSLKAFDPTARLMPHSVVEVSLEDLAKLKKQYVEFGCKPSYNIYDDKGETIDPTLLPRRFAGGHIHAGLGKLPTPVLEEIISGLDGLCALPCVGMAATMDDPVRRRFYGRAGEFRLPEHGLEYRVLSNFWMIAPPIEYLVHELFRAAIRFSMTGMYPHFFNVPQTEVRRIINECDVDAARKVVADHEDLFRHLHSYFNVYRADPQHFFDAVYKGVQGVLPCMDINTNWNDEAANKMLRPLFKLRAYASAGGAAAWTWQTLSQMLSAKSVRPVME